MLSSDFILHFSELEDPRITNHNTRHKFLDILVLAFVANLCGCDDWVEVTTFCRSKQEFFEKILELPHGIPSHDTFSRVFSLIDAQHFEELFIAWMSTIFNKKKGEIIALDGKTIRGSRTKGNTRGIHLVHAWACENKLSLGAMRVEDKTNEITVIPRLLKFLNITNCTITIDAMGCQKKIAKSIIEHGGDYVLCVKDNQKDLKNYISDTFNILEKNPVNEYSDSGKQIERAHGRKETRQYFSLPLSYFPDLADNWANIQSVTKVIRTRVIDDHKSEETQYYISSHRYLSGKIENAIRKHWNIENCLHWQLDFSFNEDLCRSRVKNEAENLALLRRISLAYLKKDKISKVGIKCKRKKAGWDDEYLLKMLSQNSNESELLCKK